MRYDLTKDLTVIIYNDCEYPCEAAYFKINFKNAKVDDFGIVNHRTYTGLAFRETFCDFIGFESYDENSKEAEAAMKLYDLTKEEYNLVINVLTEVFTFENCKCVG